MEIAEVLQVECTERKISDTRVSCDALTLITSPQRQDLGKTRRLSSVRPVLPVASSDADYRGQLFKISHPHGGHDSSRTL